jgi:hypothetical protein
MLLPVLRERHNRCSLRVHTISVKLGFVALPAKYCVARCAAYLHSIPGLVMYDSWAGSAECNAIPA